LLNLQHRKIRLNPGGLFIGLVEVVVNSLVKSSKTRLNLIVQSFERVANQLLMLFIIIGNAFFMLVTFHK
jgi:hypothetical protein